MVLFVYLDVPINCRINALTKLFGLSKARREPFKGLRLVRNSPDTAAPIRVGLRVRTLAEFCRQTKLLASAGL